MKILLAVSGGMDSMYMLSRRKELFPGAEIAVAHCNFRLRGSDSDGDEAFVRTFCDAAEVPCFVKGFDTVDYASSHGISVEMAARDLRYGWFASLMAAEGFDAVAVAHNANDNAETLLLNLLRGTGSRGLRGMGDRDIAGIGSGRILRPLLGISREEISHWMSEHGVPHREDASNASTVYRRNKLRHEVFPVFAEINPSFLKTLAVDMKHFAQVDDIAEDYFRSVAPGVLLDDNVTPDQRGPRKSLISGVLLIGGLPNGCAISIPTLLGLAHWEYVLFRLLEPYGFDEATLDSLSALLVSGKPGSGVTVSGKTFEAPAWKAVTASDRIILLPRITKPAGAGTAPDPVPSAKADSIPPTAPTVCGPLPLTCPRVDTPLGGKCLPPAAIFRFYDRPADMALKVPAGTLIMDADKVGEPVFRHWEAGDWIRPLGLRGRKKLSDLFVDLKWSLPRKESALVMVHPDGAPGHVGALLCERIDDSLKVTPSTTRILEITL